MTSEEYKYISELYIEMYNKLLIYARCSLENDALAEEAVQETFRIACQRPEMVCGSQNPRGWLVVTLKYSIRNMKSNRAAAERIVDQYLISRLKTMPFDENNISLEVLYGDLATMEEFKLIKELAVDGKSHLEMAKSRGITVAACKKRVQRAKETLKKKFNK